MLTKKLLGTLDEWVVATGAVPHGGSWQLEIQGMMEEAYAAGEAAGLAKHSCKGIPRTGCNYLSGCGTVCSKCGQIHHTHLLKH